MRKSLIILLILVFGLSLGCTGSDTFIIQNTKLNKLFDGNISGDAGLIPFLNLDGNKLEVSSGFDFNSDTNTLSTNCVELGDGNTYCSSTDFPNPDLSDYVPYSGATSDLSLGDNDIHLNSGDVFTSQYGEFGFGNETGMNVVMDPTNIYFGYSETNDIFDGVYFGYPSNSGSFKNYLFYMPQGVGSTFSISDGTSANKLEFNVNPVSTSATNFRVDLAGKNVFYAGIGRDGEPFFSSAQYHRFNKDGISYGGNEDVRKRFNQYYDAYNLIVWPDGTDRMKFDGYKTGNENLITAFDFLTNDFSFGADETDVNRLDFNLIIGGKSNNIGYDGNQLDFGELNINVDGNIWMTSPDGTQWNCGVSNLGNLECS